MIKRRDLLEKKIAIELQRAKDLSAAKNKRGDFPFPQESQMFVAVVHNAWLLVFSRLRYSQTSALQTPEPGEHSICLENPNGLIRF